MPSKPSACISLPPVSTRATSPPSGPSPRPVSAKRGWSRPGISSRASAKTASSWARRRNDIGDPSGPHLLLAPARQGHEAHPRGTDAGAADRTRPEEREDRQAGGGYQRRRV